MTRILTHAKSNAIAYLALFIALGGTSYAAATLPKNSVGARQIASSAVTSSEVKDRSLLSRDFKRGQLPRGAAGARGATGATGPQGPQGPQGPAGAAGSAKGAAFVNGMQCGSAGGGAGPCVGLVVRAGSVTARRTAGKAYCVTVAGATPANSIPIAGVNLSDSPSNTAATVHTSSANPACSAGEFQVHTQVNGAHVENVSFWFAAL